MTKGKAFVGETSVQMNDLVLFWIINQKLKMFLL